MLERMRSVKDINKIDQPVSQRLTRIGAIENLRYVLMAVEATARPLLNIHARALSIIPCRFSESTRMAPRRVVSAFVPRSHTFALMHVQSGHKQLARYLMLARMTL
jgi:hypothetical protein